MDKDNSATQKQVIVCPLCGFYALVAWAWPKIRRGIVAGLPEWYKTDVLLLIQPTGELL